MKITNRREFVRAGGALLAFSMRSRAGERPKQILVMRHAEKNAGKVDAHLNARGQARAAALPRLFPAAFDIPDFLFASRPARHSNRPVETIGPLARALQLRIDVRFPDERFASLAKEVLSNARYSGKTVLICWHHGTIPALARALGVPEPPQWSDAQFDRIWKIQYLDGAAALADLPQHLLPGDS